MSLKKLNFKRPRCDSCGSKIYPKTKPLRRANFLLGDLPLYCPNCGEKISNEKNAQVAEYGTNIYCIWCIGFLLIVVVVLIIMFTM